MCSWTWYVIPALFGLSLGLAWTAFFYREKLESSRELWREEKQHLEETIEEERDAFLRRVDMRLERKSGA